MVPNGCRLGSIEVVRRGGGREISDKLNESWPDVGDCAKRRFGG